MSPLLAVMAVLVLAAAATPPVLNAPLEPLPVLGLGPGLGPFGIGTPPPEQGTEQGAEQGADDAEDTERQSVLWRALPKRVATHGTASLREMLGRSRTSSPRKSAQFTPTGVLAENADGDMIADPGPAYPYQQQQYDDMVPRYPSSGVTREVIVRQGRLVGVVRSVPGFGEVHQFLGLPYAEPPVGSQRFMPPASPSQWKGLRVADRFGPVCPQALPDLTLQDASPGRLGHVQRLLPYLQDQSEDCLYLNVYAPSQASSHSSRLPVLVYIHGESLEWNAGTPYDGSVLAAYGKVIVVTFNFRLGILGFLRPGVHDSTVSNFGLLDQVAALQWVKDNIDALGGDPHSVTLMGHSTGAACASLLLVSPVSSNLFHRAILMSGTALADWAMTPSPLQFTIQVASELNCPLSDELAACLRKRRLSDLLAVKVNRPPFKTPFGPVVDGSVIPNEPLQLMGTYRELFSRYELLLGVTEQEAYHLLDGKSLSYGVPERDRDAMLKRYTHARFEKHPDMVLASTLAEYAQDPALYHPVAAEGQRDLLLDILSDARVAAPVIKTAELHAEANRSSYLYVFTHRTKNRNYPAVDKSVQGDELAYVFGLPLTPSAARPGNKHYTMDEKRLAETIITLWTNFAKKGDPNIPRRRTPNWPKFDTTDMVYLNISIHLSVDQHYRAQQMKYWNHDLPQLLRNPQTEPWSPQDREGNRDSAVYGVPRLFQRPRDREQLSIDEAEFQEDLSTPRRTYGTMVNSGQDDTPGAPSPPRADLELTIADVEDRDRASEDGLGRVAPSALALSVVIVVGISFLLVNVCAFGFLYYKKNRLRMQQQFFSSQCRGGGLEDDCDDAYTKKAPSGAEGGFSCSAASPPLPPPLPPPQQQPRGLGQRLRLFLNRTGPGLPRRDRQTRGAGVGAPSGPLGPASHSRADSKDDLYEAVRGASRSTSRMGRARQPAKDEGRDDAASRMRDWVAQEVVQRCSPGFLRRGRRASGRAPLSASSSTDQPDTPDDAASRSPGQSPRPGGTKAAVQKVSVAIDATPAARSSSVLRQLPIELSKSLEETARLAEAAAEGGQGGQSTVAGMTRSTPSLCSRPSLQRSEAVDEVDGLPLERRRSITSVVMDLQPSLVDIVVAPGPPSPPAATPMATPMHSFVGPRDVNVTSRDESQQAAEMCAEEALDSMRRRNYPKVLPDLPVCDAPGCGPLPHQLSAMQMAAARRRSLPPGHLQMARNMTFPCAYPCAIPMDAADAGLYNRMRPAPPPRISSTLGRRQQPVGARVMLPATPELPGSTPTPSAPTAGPGTPGTSPPQVRYEPRVIIRARDPCEDAAPLPVTQTSSSSVTLRRPEPRVIIKATSNNPVRAAATDDSDYGFTQPHPQVHMQDLPQVHAPTRPPLAAEAAEPAEPRPQANLPTPPTLARPAPAPSPSATPTASPTPARVTLATPAAAASATSAPGSPPAIAPKPVLKKAADHPPLGEASAAKPTGDTAPPPQQKSPQPQKHSNPAPASPKVGAGATKAPPTPPPMPSGGASGGATKKQQQQRKASDSGSKTGTIKKGKKK